MPLLTWPTKSLKDPLPGALRTDSLVCVNGQDTSPGNSPDRLILGDNLAVMAALLPEYEGRINLIYADPPFFTNRRFPARVGRGEDSRKPQEWQLAEGYPDSWRSLDDYLDMLYPRLAIMHRLLASNGTLYLHLDWHASAYARLLLDEIFGFERMLNEIAWIYHGPSPIRSAFNRKHDTILVYTKSEQYTFNVDAVRQPYNPVTVRTFASSPKAGFGKIPDLERGKVPEDWWYFPVVARLHNERTGYPTQKPAALLERILLASSNPGDLVADFFCGSGTTPVTSAHLGRRYIAADSAWRAVHTTYARLIGGNAPPFQLEIERKAEKIVAPEPMSPLPIRLGNQVYLSKELLASVEFWEIDTAWDGLIFHSHQQARRTKKGSIEPSISIPENIPGPIAVRSVTIDDRLLLSVIG